MKVEFVAVQSSEQVAQVALVAHDIWHEYWPGRIPAGQVDYMVSTMQSADAIAADIEHRGYRYWFIMVDGQVAGYTAAKVEDFSETPDDPGARVHGDAICDLALRRLFISKIYLYAEQRGRHLASRTIEFYERLCRDEGLPVMYLTVNRGNDLAIRAYKGRGFEVIEDFAADIGQGYVMDDHIMAKRVGDAS